MTPEERAALRARLLHYATERRKMLSLDTEHIHSLHSPPSPRHAELLLSDVEAAAAALAPPPTCGTCEQLRAERDEARALHQELMFQVGKKYPGETRHETAKRYIREHEHCGQGGPAYAPTEPTR